MGFLPVTSIESETQSQEPASERGSRGPYLEKVDRYLLNYLQPPSQKIYPGGEAIIANDGPTLAWIAGSAKAFTEKDHNYTTGEKLQKQAVLINDTRATQDFSFNWQVKVNGQPIARGEQTGQINAAQTLFFPIEADLPAVSAKTDGEILLTATIGQFPPKRDRFPFRVFSSSPNPQQISLTAVDPVGKTTQMLQQLGYNVTPWQGSATNSLLIIGREALTQNAAPAALQNLKSQIANGARAIIFSPNREWLQEQLGLRVAQPLSRRVFPINPEHPVVQGLDAEDLRDWRGESTLIEAYPNTVQHPSKASPYATPWYGWHWGNRGAVSSAAIEKPHLSGWRPILEAEFDLAYSPLMELNYGKGRLILCTLDLEDHLQDAAVRQLTHQLIAYAATAPLPEQAEKVIFIGSDEEAQFLNKLGINYQPATTLSDANLAIVGESGQVSDRELQGYLERGGKALFFPRKSPSNLLGVQLKAVDNFGGSLNVPNWQEMAGISPSDLRARTNYKTELINSGGEVGADGLFSRIQTGKGVAIFTQLSPEKLNADTQTYLRYTRWRQTRAIAQILANLGATFKADAQIFDAISSASPTQSFYYPDYRTDFDLGDDPYRYYRW